MSGPSQLRQGGDLGAGALVKLDLSTCVNPYGPPEAVLAALRGMPASVVRKHPFAAAGEVESAYADFIGRPAAEFVAGQGASELIWSLAQLFRGKSIGVPLPGYTEFRQAFPQARLFGGGPSTHAIEVLDEAMRACDVVIISNPHNPTGQVIAPETLARVAGGNPKSMLVVDESYLDFLPDAAALTLIGCEQDNVIVLRSPSKFWGLAGVRSGVAWSRQALRPQLDGTRTNWPVSAFAAHALKIALADHNWAMDRQRQLAADVAWLDGFLARSGLSVAPGRLHFRLATGSAGEVTRFADSLWQQEIAVRIFPEGYGIGRPALRIAAPPEPERWRLPGALGTPSSG